MSPCRWGNNCQPRMELLAHNVFSYCCFLQYVYVDSTNAFRIWICSLVAGPPLMREELIRLRRTVFCLPHVWDNFSRCSCLVFPLNFLIFLETPFGKVSFWKFENTTYDSLNDQAWCQRFRIPLQRPIFGARYAWYWQSLTIFGPMGRAVKG